MITGTDIATSKPTVVPKCVSQLLATFDAMAATLSGAGPKGPYAFDAISEALSLCPALFETPAVGDNSHARFVNAIEEARSAVRVVRSCPGSDWHWAAERLREVVESARLQLEVRVKDTRAIGNSSGLFADRCSTCVSMDN